MPTPTWAKEPVVEVRGQDCGQEASEGQRVAGSEGVLQDNSQDRESHVCKQIHGEKTQQTLWLHEFVIFSIWFAENLNLFIKELSYMRGSGYRKANKRFTTLLMLPTVCELTKLMQSRSSLALLMYFWEDFRRKLPESLRRRENCLL